MKFVFAVLVVVVLTSTSFAQRPWKFIVTCDSRGNTNGINQTILRELVTEIENQGFDFVLFPGDLVSGFTASGPDEFEAQLRVWVEIMKPVYDANIPVYVCRGNHEVSDNWGGSPETGTDPNDNYAFRWLKVFGSDFYPDQKLPGNGPAAEKYMTYSVTHKNALIVVLDQYAGMRHRTDHKVNQRWLDAQLAANTKPHIFVTGHEPAFQAIRRDCLDTYPANRDAFWASIKNAGGRTYLTGHDHFYDHACVDDGDSDPSNDIHQYIIGTAGAWPYIWSSPYDGNNSVYTVEQWHHAERFGYVLVEIDDLDVTLVWMERHTNDLNTAGIYEPNDVWSYTVVPKPIVLSPNGGENLATASTYTITWKTLEGVTIDYVTIEYSPDNGQSWEDIDISRNTGSYEWNVPLADSNQCLLRVADLHNSTLNDTSDKVFTIFHCQRQLVGDLNGDCYVDFLDFAILAENWLKCGNPFDPSCGTQE